MSEFIPKKVFILKNGKYIELSYQEFERLKIRDPSYNGRFFIQAHEYIMEVSQMDHEKFYKEKERAKYLKKVDKQQGLLSIDAFDTEDNNGTDYIHIETEDVAETVIRMMLISEVLRILPTLSEDERELIDKHYFQNIPQTELADQLGITQQAISKRISRICAKIRKILIFWL